MTSSTSLSTLHIFFIKISGGMIFVFVTYHSSWKIIQILINAFEVVVDMFIYWICMFCSITHSCKTSSLYKSQSLPLLQIVIVIIRNVFHEQLYHYFFNFSELPKLMSTTISFPSAHFSTIFR